MFRNFVNIFILFEAHIPKNREHYESSDKTCETVYSGGYKSIPTNWSKQLVIYNSESYKVIFYHKGKSTMFQSKNTCGLKVQLP